MDVWSVNSLADQIFLLDRFDQRESRNIAALIWTDVFFFKKNEEVVLSPSDHIRVSQLLHRLKAGEPVQYIIEHTWFYGLKFKVTPDVLIPRPETEELLHWILTDLQNKSKQLRILDIGTGSGCIPIVLKKHLDERAEIISIDISAAALEIAKENATSLNLQIDFRQHDFLTFGFSGLGVFDIIVSNPPYISADHVSENLMRELQFEPQTALYPHGNDPDIFYKKILDEGQAYLHAGGSCYLELNEFRADIIRKIALKTGWKEIEVRMDMQGMARMLKAEIF